MKKILSLLFYFFIFVFSSCGFHPSPLPAVTLSSEAAAAMKSDNRYWIEVQIPQRKLILAKGNQIMKAFPIAVGMPEFPTPTGWRKINQVVWNPWWRPPKTSSWVEDATPIEPRSKDNPLGEMKMPLGKDYYLIHGTKAANSIGRWASHGCIRMMFDDVFGVVQILLTQYSNVSALDQMQKANTDMQTEFATPLNKDVPVFLSYEPIKVINDKLSISPDLYKHLPDFMTELESVVKPYLKSGKELNMKKIRAYIKMAKDQTVTLPLDQIVH